MCNNLQQYLPDPELLLPDPKMFSTILQKRKNDTIGDYWPSFLVDLHDPRSKKQTDNQMIFCLNSAVCNV